MVELVVELLVELVVELLVELVVEFGVELVVHLVEVLQISKMVSSPGSKKTCRILCYVNIHTLSFSQVAYFRYAFVSNMSNGESHVEG